MLTLTISTARRRWGGRRVPFAPDEPPGGPRSLPFAQRAICVRGVARGFRGMCPRCQSALSPPVAQQSWRRWGVVAAGLGWFGGWRLGAARCAAF
jgi:hypothetical protein